MRALVVFTFLTLIAFATAPLAAASHGGCHADLENAVSIDTADGRMAVQSFEPDPTMGAVIHEATNGGELPLHYLPRTAISTTGDVTLAFEFRCVVDVALDVFRTVTGASFFSTTYAPPCVGMAVTETLHVGLDADSFDFAFAWTDCSTAAPAARTYTVVVVDPPLPAPLG